MKEENDDEIDILVCAKTEGMSRPVYGSIRADCLKCESPVWVSASGQNAMSGNKNLKPCCIECAGEKMKDEDEIKASIVPGAIDELKRYFMKVEDN
ncbi:MAG: hypothetical protein ABI686_02900 [Acidobacteriota bacterium]